MIYCRLYDWAQFLLSCSSQVRCYTPCFQEDLTQSQARMDLTSLIVTELTSGISWITFALDSLSSLKTRLFVRSFSLRQNSIKWKEWLMTWKQDLLKIRLSCHQINAKSWWTGWRTPGPWRRLTCSLACCIGLRIMAGLLATFTLGATTGDQPWQWSRVEITYLEAIQSNHGQVSCIFHLKNTGARCLGITT